MKSAILGAAVVAASHYEKPPCGSDEVEGQIGSGIACLPTCDSSGSCPTDVPSGVTAQPQCALQDASSGKKFCGLICQKDTQCGDAKCQIMQGSIGICTYSQTSETASPFHYRPFMSEDDHMAAFEDFVAKHSKTYESEQEKAIRYNVFKENRVYINHSNQDGDVSYALNEFADLTHAEFKAMYVGGYRPDLTNVYGASLGTHVYSGAELPSEVDWTTKGAVTPVKNQGQCGSCWSFSTTGSLEGAFEIATGKLVSVSEQQLVDCAKSFGEQGCSGGLMDNAFKYAEQADMCTEESYPYTAADGTCHASGCTVAIKKGQVTGFKDVAHDEQSLMEAIAMGPVSIAIEADQQAFQFYSGGVLSQPCGTQLDHGVLAVGYGELEGKKYWKVKNSWGGSWGSAGYILLERENSPDGASGECGILSDPSYPIIAKSADMLI